MRNIPPLNPVHVFEVVARTGSFTRAAKKLRVTQSAVSRQVATLEDYLGVRLFDRESNGVTLTHEGSEYLADIGSAFDAIARATSNILGRYKSNIVRVTCYPTFATKWLIPRLSGFNERYQDIQVKLETKVVPSIKSDGPQEVAIQLCDPGQITQETSLLLFKDRFQPFCSPKFLERHDIQTVEDLLALKRLGSYYRRNDWRDWMEAMGHPDLLDDRDDFMSSLLTYKAACEGLGVAICQNFLVEDEVKSGALVPLFQPIERELGHYIMWNKAANYRARTFVKWLYEELAAGR